MFARWNPNDNNLNALVRVENIVRNRYGIEDDQLVLVTEEDTRLPDGPDRMTTILFWGAADTRHKARVFKPAAQVSADDLPVSWLRAALLDDGDPDCC